MVPRLRHPLLQHVRIPVLAQTAAAQGCHLARGRHVGIGIMRVVQLDTETFGDQF